MYKLILLLNLFHPYLEYSTTSGQTIIWRKKTSLLQESMKINKPFQEFYNNAYLLESLEKISTLDYEWIQQNDSLFQFSKEDELIKYLEEAFSC